jgi:hypothetical protein
LVIVDEISTFIRLTIWNNIFETHRNYLNSF